MNIIYKISEKFVKGLGCDYLTIEAVKEKKVIKQVSFYENISTWGKWNGWTYDYSLF